MNDDIKVYIAGPMESAGGNFNFPLFDAIAQVARNNGCEVFSPADYARKLLGPLEDIKKMPKADLKKAVLNMLPREIDWICVHADYMLMLPGWAQSPGACIEHAVAVLKGIKIVELPNVVLPNEVELSNMLSTTD